MPIKQRPNPPMYPGGMEIDAEEEAAVLEVLRNKRLFRYYGPNPGPSKAEELEHAFAAHMGVATGAGSHLRHGRADLRPAGDRRGAGR